MNMRTLVQKHTWSLFGLSVLCILVVVSNLCVPLIIGATIDSICAPHAVDFSRVHFLLSVLALLICATTCAQWGLNALANSLTYICSAELRQRVFAHIQQLPMSYLDSHNTGDITNRLISDVDQMSTGLISSFQQIPSGILSVVVTLIAMLILSWQLALFVALATPVSLWLARTLVTRSGSHYANQARDRGQLAALTEEAIYAHETIASFSYEDQFCTDFAACNERLSHSTFYSVFFSSLVNPASRFAGAIIYLIIAGAGAYAALNAHLSIGLLTAFLAYTEQYIKPFNDISNIMSDVQNARSCAARLFSLLNEVPLANALPQEISPHKASQRAASTATQASIKPKALPAESIVGTVQFCHVDFAYQTEKSVLNDINLTALPGQTIALVGQTGSGKTTLINLLMRFYEPTRGTIYIDGHDIRDIPRAHLRRLWGMVLQESWIAPGSVRDNLLLGNPHASNNDLIDAAQTCCIHDFIMSLPQGYDTPLHDGVSLSAGQKQLLCISRVMLAHPRMLILDEATSNIDTRTEQTVQQALLHLMDGRTCFVVAHRLSTIQEADQICVMDHGRIIETGTHQELLACKGAYASLINLEYSK